MMIPETIKWQKSTNALRLEYDTGEIFSLPIPYLRAYSPSAENLGHGGEKTHTSLDVREVTLQGLAPTGDYAIQLHFSDDHRTGLYTFAYLYTLALHQAEYWQAYLDGLGTSHG